MDVKLVEEITRLVLSKLEESSEPTLNFDYPPLTEEEVKEWNEISSAIMFSKGTNDVPSYLAPLTNEELKMWNVLSDRIGFKKSVNFSSVAEQSGYRPLTDKELKDWNDLGKKRVVRVRNSKHGEVKFFQHQ
nr:hypothetical protein [Neobacillus sp. Marseille-Q6967]